MNKKIIAIAIATAMAAPVAMADMKMYGTFGGDFVNVDDGTDTSRGFQDNGASQMNFAATSGSAYGKFAFNMGPGANAGEMNTIYTDTTGDGFTADDTVTSSPVKGSVVYRDYYLGYNFAGGSSAQFGTMAGALKNLEKDPLIATFLQVRGTYASARTDKQFGSSSFVSNLIQYKMKAGAANINIQFDPTDNATSSHNSGHAAVAVTGKAGGVNYWAGFNNGAGSETGADDSNMKVGASMKFGTIKATLNYTSADTGASDWNSIAVTGDMKLGNGLSALATFASTTGDKEGTFTRIAVIKSIGPKARIYGGFASNDPEVGDAETSIGAGMSVKF